MKLETQPTGAPPTGSTSFAVSAPTLSVPRGGGALQAIGESFAVAAATGTASLSIPISVGALRYDSGAGNGPFGVGWSVDAPSIARRTERGLPRYGDDDVFVLAGAEDLVPALVEDGGAWVVDERGEDDHVVRRYRPRVEGGFARIERWTNVSTGDAWWLVIGRDNATQVFGRSPAARLADPDDPRRIWRWLLEESRDEVGHVTVYEYKAEDRVGVADAIHEASRARAGSRCAQTYLKRIRHGNRRPFVADDWGFEVVFDYGEHDQTPEEVRPWSVRQDPFSSFRAGFDVRTYRLCRRVLVFHQLAELGDEPVLVRATELAYEESAAVALLTRVTVTGYLRDGAGYRGRSLPALELGYSPATIAEELGTVTGIDNLPAGLDGRAYQWIDLDGDGLAGVLARDGTAWRWKRNEGDGALGAQQVLAEVPSLATRTDCRLMSLAGDGRVDLVRLAPGPAGYHERTAGGGWEDFVAFTSAPVIDWNDANLRLLDLDGDGRADVLVTDDDALVWRRSEGRAGWGDARRVGKPADERDGPALLFADREQTVFLADMTGDGLTDLVRIRNGSVSYWPNRGHGRFGARISMGGAPWFDDVDRFDPARVRIADVDGDGPADLIYLDRSGARVWLNQAGNRFAAAAALARFPGIDSATDVEVVDLLGDGTGCLVWSTRAPTPSTRLRYLRLLAAGKPHLLTSIADNLGSETALEYAPSTRFFLADRAAGRPWLTTLPFPVQVVAAITRRDRVTGRKLTTTYAYHHGYFDGVERELRGFAHVEQRDTEVFDDFDDGVATNAIAALHVPPVLTRTWFHTGAWRDGESLAQSLAGEYFGGDAQLPDTTLPAGTATDEAREACRALRGRVLRREVYAEDDDAAAAVPYLVTESSYQLRRLQPFAGQAHAVFAAFAAETLTFQYERDADDPRVTHAIDLEVDDWGNVVRAARIAYPRRSAVYDEQRATTITVDQATFIAQADRTDAFHLGLPSEQWSWELTGLAGSSATPLTARAVDDAFAAATTLAYEASASAGLERRLLAHGRITYWNDDLTGPLSLGTVGLRALPYERSRLALTGGQVRDGYGGRVTAELLAEAGYVADGDDWWATSGRQELDRGRFYQPVRVIDPFGGETRIGYDDRALFAVEVVDPIGNVTRAAYDYRVLQASQLTDPNGNRTAVSFDELGLVIAVAVMGKDGAGEGDTLADPTRTLTYDVDAWRARRQPVSACTRARELHGAANVRWQESYAYSDGARQVVMSKVRAAAGPAPVRDAGGALELDADGQPVLADTATRWIGTGRTVVDNKGNPVKQYEPFFSSTSAYEDEAELVEQGVTPVRRFDPIGRNVRTDLPDGTVRRIDVAAWQQSTWDENDTVLDSDWYAARAGLPADDPDRRAATLAAEHAATPAVVHLDPQGRAFLAIEDNGAAGRYETRTVLDVQGNARAVIDARGLVTQRQDFAVTGQVLHAFAADSGDTWTLVDVVGRPVRVWRAGELALRHAYDVARRPTHVWVREGDGAERLVERTVYGEAHASPEAGNLRGRVHLVLDGAGLVVHDAYDLDGQLVATSRRLAADPTAALDWAATAELTAADEVLAAAAPSLDAEVFAATSAFDALGRPIRQVGPDGSVTTLGYDDGGRLTTVDVAVRGAATATAIVTAVSYDARGQRESIVYGNGATTRYTHDPLTFRLAQVLTTRAADGATLQELSFTFDAVGNVVAIADDAQQTLFFANGVAPPSAAYEYDALYRLVVASGREHASATQVGVADPAYGTIPDAADAGAVVGYVESYAYDAVGNVASVKHEAAPGTWTRRYQYAADSNRLAATSEDGDDDAGPYSSTYGHDERGGMTAMPHLAAIVRDWRDQIASVDLGGGGAAYYAYDAGNQRVRKRVVRLGAVSEERIYLGAYEVYRKRRGDVLEEERQTVHAGDGARRIAMIETLTVSGGAAVASPVSRLRLQLDNHLGSALLELDETAAIISYEEYHPYGTTAYQAKSAAEVSAKRYRYTGKEKDDETGLYYHGARTYAPWLARWTSADPVGLAAGINRYMYVRGRPIIAMDPSGYGDVTPEDVYSWVQDNIGDPLRAAALRNSPFAGTAEMLADLDSGNLQLPEYYNAKNFEGTFNYWFNIVSLAGSGINPAAGGGRAVAGRLAVREGESLVVREGLEQGIVHAAPELAEHAAPVVVATDDVVRVVSHGVETEVSGSMVVREGLGGAKIYQAADHAPIQRLDELPILDLPAAERPDLAQGSRAVPRGLDVLEVGDAFDRAYMNAFPKGSIERGQRVWSLNYGLRQDGSLALSVSGNGRRLNDAQFALVRDELGRLGYGDIERLSIGSRTADVGSRTPLHAEGPGRLWIERQQLTLGGQYTTAYHCVGCTSESVERNFTTLNLSEFYTNRVIRLPR